MTTPARQAWIVSRGLGLSFALTASLVGLGLGLVVSGVPGTEWVLTAGLMALVVMPVLRLVAVLGGLVRAREWPFVWAGVAVLALLLGTLFWRSD